MEMGCGKDRRHIKTPCGIDTTSVVWVRQLEYCRIILGRGWRTRSGVYQWLRPLCRRLRVTFTPHMARHHLGKRLNAGGRGIED
jgi:hypothetical protein